jgi:hypothetical protein
VTGYAKMFAAMLTSSVWQESHATVRVWVTMLLLKDQDGIVNASVPGLAHAAHVTLDECQQALEVLAGPDPYSRTPDLEGRRIVKAETGWRVVNHTKYRELMSAADRRAYKRKNEQARRDRKRGASERRTGGQSVDTQGQT